MAFETEFVPPIPLKHCYGDVWFAGDTQRFSMSDKWVVLTKGPRATGPFASRTKAKNFATCYGGIALTWYEPEGVCDGWDHEGAVWFDNDWNAPVVIGGPFFDCKDVWSICTFPSAESGIAIELERPDDFWGGDDDGEPIDDVANDNNAAGGQSHAA
jgi:hypothetical protein